MANVVEVEVVAAGICGSDTMRVRTGFDPSSVGHELVALYQDELYVVCPMSACGRCAFCVRGLTQHCERLQALGRCDDHRGGFCGFVTVEKSQLRSLPPSLPVAVATLADPLACILAALEGIDPNGRRALVIGDGGLACVASSMLLLSGARVEVVAKCHRRANLLNERLHLSAICSEDVTNDTYDIVLEAVGGATPSPVNLALRAVGHCGYIRMLGVFDPVLIVSTRVRSLFEKEASIRGSKSYPVESQNGKSLDLLDQAIEILNESPACFSKIITHTFDLSNLEQLLAALHRRGVGRSVGIRISSEDTRGYQWL